MGPPTVASGSKAHHGIDAATLEIRPIDVTENATGDAPILPYLLDRFPLARPPRVLAVMVPTTPKAVTRRSRNVGAGD
jgi:hypothetical protein